MKPIDSNFGHWFSGFADGESCFGVYWTNNRTAYFMFKISLRDDDAEVLHMIHRTLGIGRVSFCKNGGDNPVANFLVNRLPDLHDCLLPLFRQFPLRSKKRHDFDIFSKMVEMKYKCYWKSMPQEEQVKFERMRNELCQIKKYGSAS
jgi:hypothetical protein